MFILGKNNRLLSFKGYILSAKKSRSLDLFLFKQMEYFEMPDLSALLDPAIRDTPSTREEIPTIGCPEKFKCTVRSYQGCAFPRAQPLP